MKIILIPIKPTKTDNREIVIKATNQKARKDWSEVIRLIGSPFDHQVLLRLTIAKQTTNWVCTFQFSLQCASIHLPISFLILIVERKMWLVRTRKEMQTKMVLDQRQYGIVVVQTRASGSMTTNDVKESHTIKELLVDLNGKIDLQDCVIVTSPNESKAAINILLPSGEFYAKFPRDFSEISPKFQETLWKCTVQKRTLYNGQMRFDRRR